MESRSLTGGSHNDTNNQDQVTKDKGIVTLFEASRAKKMVDQKSKNHHLWSYGVAFYTKRGGGVKFGFQPDSKEVYCS